MEASTRAPQTPSVPASTSGPTSPPGTESWPWCWQEDQIRTVSVVPGADPAYDDHESQTEATLSLEVAGKKNPLKYRAEILRASGRVGMTRSDSGRIADCAEFSFEDVPDIALGTVVSAQLSVHLLERGQLDR